MRKKSRTGTELGALLRHWRDVRGRSQLDLSLDTGVSQRHLSFIESGRSVPSRQILMDLAQAMDVPLRERNALLLASGYAPMYSEAPWDAAEMRNVKYALERILRQHEPYPAVVMDRYWNVLMTNAAAPRFFGRFIDIASRERPRNMLRLMFDPAGMRPFIANWESVAQSLIQRVQHEAVGHVMDNETGQLLKDLLAYPDVDATWKNPAAFGATPALPVIPINFVSDDRVLSLFSMVTTVGTPQSVATQELRIECLFPADDETEAGYASLMDEHPTAI
jgi:transcriptional regulator with XRE-family HTH domain